MSEKIRVRFAPSPTGPLHIGGARSALFNWLFARGKGGKMVLRVEDTDVERSTRVSEEEILESLRWLGMDWDEGVDVGGDKGPYRQRERLHIYNPYVDKLLKKGKAYYCFCQEEELESERQEMLRTGDTPKYSGRCRSLSKEEVSRRLAKGEKGAVRFHVHPGEQVVIEDQVRGTVTFETDGIGDFIIIKSDGIPTYNFAVVIDDLEMEISHVIRAEEHLSNTPRQVLLYQALEVPVPVFAHISLILGEDRSKMSKRHGATSIVQYREMGYLPEALLNFLALLGWAPEGEQEIFTSLDLIEVFDLKRVSKSPAVFNLQKLNWMNSQYLKNASAKRLMPLALPYLHKAGFIAENISPEAEEWLLDVVASVQSKMDYLAQIPGHAAVYFGETKDPAGEEELEILKGTAPLLEELLTRLTQVEAWDEDAIKGTLKALGKDLKVKGKDLFMPVRVAVSGQTWGPELPAMMRLLGKEGVRKRISHSIKFA